MTPEQKELTDLRARVARLESFITASAAMWDTDAAEGREAMLSGSTLRETICDTVGHDCFVRSSAELITKS